MYMIKFTEFRKDLSNQFNKALTEPIIVTRGGVSFQLAVAATVPTKISLQDVASATPSPAAQLAVQKAMVEAHKLQERFSNGMCKTHGTPLTNNGKCLQKGCKF